jgi:ankyrin repeat protein
VVLLLYLGTSSLFSQRILADCNCRHAAADAPDPTLISWFLNNGADPNKKCTMDITPLSTAAGCAPLAIVKQLLDWCPPDTTFRGGLLHWAARRKPDAPDAVDVVKLILDRCHTNVNHVEYEDDFFSYGCQHFVGLGTALHSAARIGSPLVVDFLIQKGTDITIRDSCGKTALEVAQAHENHPAIELLQRAERRLAARI